jgi:hypothetical protein
VRQSVLAGGEVAEIYSKLLFLLFSKRKIWKENVYRI